MNCSNSTEGPLPFMGGGGGMGGRDGKTYLKSGGVQSGLGQRELTTVRSPAISTKLQYSTCIMYMFCLITVKFLFFSFRICSEAG